jgi:hypothetical protein
MARKGDVERGGGGVTIERAPDLEPRRLEPLEAPHLTDLGNARRLVERHGQDVLYHLPDGPYFTWDGVRDRHIINVPY